MLAPAFVFGAFVVRDVADHLQNAGERAVFVEGGGA